MSSLRDRAGGPDDDLRAGPWRGDRHTAQVTPPRGAPSVAAVRACLARLVDDGYRAVLTTALGPPEQAPFLDVGFEVHERLHLLAHDLSPIPDAPRLRLRRARRRDRPRVLEVDAAAFPPFWRLDDAALDDALTATPTSRFRVGPPSGPVNGYAITGRAGPRGYLQRLAVDPAHQREGLGTALVVDGLRWARRWGAREVLVNTQEGNDVAVATYEALGFVARREGLAVLRCELTPT
jgi:ribosomal protein S18 acetylase RimI-like enzyme